MSLYAALLFGLLACLLMALLSYLSRLCPRDADTLSHRINSVLPQTQCAQCGYPGCAPYAEAIAAGAADIDRCPPGGDDTIVALANLLGVSQRPLAQDLAPVTADLVAVIDESECIGCALCLPACPVDAIVGAPKSLHTILSADCTGCELCIAPCPVDCIAMVMRADEDDWLEMVAGQGAGPDARPDARTLLVERLRDAGLEGMGGAGFPTWRKIANLELRERAVLVVNAVECEPGLAADAQVLALEGASIAAGVDALRGALLLESVVLAVKRSHAAAVDALIHQCQALRVDLEPVWLNAGYPAGDERNLFRMLTDCELAAGCHPGDFGVLVLNVATVAAIGQLLTTGRLPRSRRLTLHGDALAPRVVTAALGATFAEVIANAGIDFDAGANTLRSGGAMMGDDASPETRVTRSTTGIYLRSHPDSPTPASCIRCQLCVPVCPQVLPVSDLVSALERDGLAVDATSLARCTACRCCDVVCPSHIPIASRLRDARAKAEHERIARAEARALEARSQSHERRQQARKLRSPSRPVAGAKPTVDGLLAAARARRQRDSARK